MTDATVDEAALFAEFSQDKGDRLADLVGANADDGTGEATGASPASTVETTAAAPAADTTTTTSAQPAAAASAAAATDIWANASPEIRAAHQAALALADQKYRSDIGRQAAYQRRIQLLEQELEARKPADAAATASATPTTDTAAPADGALAPARKASLLDNPEARRSREEYPEAVEPFAQIIEKLESRLDAIDSDMNLTREDRAQQTTAVQEAALNAAHPDWRAACESKDFVDWLNVQPKAIKDIVQRNGQQVVDAEEAIAMVSNFKAHLALKSPPPPPPPPPEDGAAPKPNALDARREAQLRSVTGTTTKGGPVPLPDGPAANGQESALFNHFSAKKAQQRKR